MEIKRDLYLQRLIDRMHNGMIKVALDVYLGRGGVFFVGTAVFFA